MPEPVLPDTAAGHEDAALVQKASPVRTNWFFYGLGLALQTVLWLLLFLAIIVAVVVGTHRTEFRYVGF